MATVEESVLKTEMAGLESQEEDAPKRLLFYKPMSWLGQISPHRPDESWSASLWQTFVSTSMGAQIPVIAEKPLATCDLFRTTHKVKTQQVVKNRGQHCGDIELTGYLANESGPVPLVLDLRIAHDRVGSSNIVLTTTTGHRVWYHL